MAATLKEIAELAGVSATTVSLVARGVRGRVSDAVRAKVLRAIDQAGYIPDESAKRLRRRRGSGDEPWPRTGRIGVVVYGGYDKHAHPFWGRLLDAFESVARDRGLEVAWSEGEETLVDRAAYGRRLNPEMVDGVVCAGVSNKVVCERLGEFARPVVSVPASSDGARPDFVAGGAMAIDHLVELGHRRVAYILPPRGGSAPHERADGAELAFTGAGIDPPAEWRRSESRLGFETGLRVGRELVSAQERPTGIMTGNDLTALGVMRAAAEAGLTVPADLSVVGFNGDDVGEYCTPPLTTIHMDAKAVAGAALDRLEVLFKRPETPPSVTVVPVSLLVRESTAPAPLGT